MGEWDYYCFLCAAGFYSPHNPGHDEQDESQSDSDETDEPGTRPKKAKRLASLLTQQSIAWLEDFRVIGENTAASGLRRCYLSGRAQIDYYGTAQVEKGHDSVAPGQNPDDTNATPIYRNFDANDETGALPVHDCCLRVLQRAAYYDTAGRLVEDADFGFHLDDGTALAVEQDDYHTNERGQVAVDTALRLERAGRAEQLDIDALFHCVSARREEYRSSLHLDYGAMTDMANQQFFFISREHQPYVLDPFNIKQMQSFADTLPPLETAIASPVNTTTIRSAAEINDPFSRLPLELVTMIYHRLPQEALVKAILTSRSLGRVRTCNWFWRQRLKLDMPWAWELHELEKDIDWYRAYILLAQEVKDPFRSSIPALANRKRVWSACDQVLSLYRGYLQANTLSDIEDDTVSSAMRHDAKLEYFPHVATSSESAKNVMTVWFPLNASFMQSEKRLVAYWKDRSLAGLAIILGDQQTNVGNTTDVDKFEEILIAQNDWLQSFTLHIVIEPDKDSHMLHDNFVVGLTIELLSGTETVLGKTKGDKRLLMPQQGRAVVGMKVEMTGGIVTRMGLLEYALSGMNHFEETGDPAILKHLWTDKLPLHRGITFGRTEVGYWGMSFHPDLVPFTCLWFGSDQREASLPPLETMTGISGSHDGRSWRVHRKIDDVELAETGGPVREEHEMRFLAIDGSGGERIIGVETDIGPCITGVRLITNKGRQCLLGSYNNSKLRYSAEQDRYIIGIYCSHGYDSAQTQMTTFSIITAPCAPFASAPSLPDFEALKDRRGLPWEPSPPCADYAEISSTYYGTSANGERATFLDFSRPVDRITGLFAASPQASVGSIGGFSIVYADGNIVFCGPTTRSGTADDTSASGFINDTMKEQQKAEIAHVSNYEDANALATDFDACGEKIQRVRVWAAAYLHGIQFVTETGRGSPRWGKCGGPAATEIVAGSIIEGRGSAPVLEEVDENWARSMVGIRMKVVGVKVILGSRKYERGYPDVRPLAVEIMGSRSGAEDEQDTGGLAL